MTQPLKDILVLDFSTLLPGPMATLMLSEAGAEVVKFERPGTGEDARHTDPMIDGESIGFAVLNQGKRSVALDLKAENAVNILRPLLEKADVLVEQFRPGVMGRLGLGYEAVRAINPGIVYCSITGYGQTGPKATAAGHDLNYVGDAGVLSLSRGPDAHPTMPFGLIADIGGGTYPAVVNILLALIARQKTGKGAHLDIAMAEGAFAFAYWAHAEGVIAGQDIENGGGRLTGGLARYRLYSAADGRQIAVGALEEKFWQAFCDVIDQPADLRDDWSDPEGCSAEVARRLGSQPSTHWEPLLVAADCCCSVVKTPAEAATDPHFSARGVFDRKLDISGKSVPALPLPIAPEFRVSKDVAGRAASLGEDNLHYGAEPRDSE
ncbi:MULTISPECIES: CaiB/BaiF CoA transferase family protein [Alphaproteobacteria]|jgi:alpha-methylacyl-CoA racemase|uniref:Acetyl-CoA:oxalate CoA-transferase n=2 Tax=Alphaproteobacteria TaxID=28211 RepID=A0AAX3AEZ7_9RHOB|nr:MULTISPECIES: CaiB/BaiF CoA-transferase family protein [Sulfitobacter]AXI52606.1 CoA transferase [Sulfitobacter sp. SK025]UOA24708.1 Acetyl-CoA:oxalate CoA-transferase [Sulfitobacter pontiacus]WPZ26950.1 CaiB/BaiF CoA-transferase family protein [Sulfitobacter pontiacus]HJO51097.1 CaiB/BaiF CoA-transferase family protein [Sulfitobacter pontiacus]